MFAAVDPSLAAIIAAFSGVVAVGATIATNMKRGKVDTTTMIVTGFEKLNAANIARIDELEEHVARQETNEISGSVSPRTSTPTSASANCARRSAALRPWRHRDARRDPSRHQPLTVVQKPAAAGKVAIGALVVSALVAIGGLVLRRRGGTAASQALERRRSARRGERAHDATGLAVAAGVDVTTASADLDVARGESGHRGAAAGLIQLASRAPGLASAAKEVENRAAEARERSDGPGGRCSGSEVGYPQLLAVTLVQMETTFRPRGRSHLVRLHPHTTRPLLAGAGGWR